MTAFAACPEDCFRSSTTLVQLDLKWDNVCYTSSGHSFLDPHAISQANKVIVLIHWSLDMHGPTLLPGALM